MATELLTSAVGFQNFYSTNLTSDITNTALDIFLDSVPSPSEGVLIIDPESASLREIIYYTSKTGTKVTCPANGRGYDNSTATSHTAGTTVIMAPVADYFECIKSGQILESGSVTTAKIADSNVTHTKLASGIAVGGAGTTTGAVASGTTIIPTDDTIPQITEGTEFLSLSYTPKSATNLLVIEVQAFISTNTTVNINGALFQDATANALAACSSPVSGADDVVCLNIKHVMAAGTTSATTFRFRAGPASAETITLNGINGSTRRFGGVYSSTMTVAEYKG